MLQVPIQLAWIDFRALINRWRAFTYFLGDHIIVVCLLLCFVDRGSGRGSGWWRDRRTRGRGRARDDHSHLDSQVGSRTQRDIEVLRLLVHRMIDAQGYRISRLEGADGLAQLGR